MDRSPTVAIELALCWSSADAEHTDRYYLPRVDLPRDPFPGSLGERLAAAGPGLPVSEEFAAGVLVDPFEARRVLTLHRDRLASELGGHPLGTLHLGRFYPRAIAAGALDTLSARDTRPLRVVAMDEETVTLDLNHPLAAFGLTLEGRIDAPQGEPVLDRGGRGTDIAGRMTSRGPGLQAALPRAPTDFLYPGALSREDQDDDAAFYGAPRLVHHLDAVARARVAEIYARFLEPGHRVLDLMSSWRSHLAAAPGDLEVVGLGMNRDELAANPRLAGHVVHDLNRDPVLPLPDARFDAAICTVSVEYLIRPIEVFEQVARVLRPGAPFVLTFSERWFPPKVIRLWPELHPFERMGLVLEYFRRSAGFQGLGTDSIRGLRRPADDQYAPLYPHADPIYAVWGRRRQTGPS